MSGATAAIELDLVAGGLSFPTSVAFAADGAPLVAESGLPFGGAPVGGRVLRLGAGGPRILADRLRPPVNGLTAYHDVLLVSEGGHPAGITRLNGAGVREPVLATSRGLATTTRT